MELIPFNKPYAPKSSMKFASACIRGSKTQAGGYFSRLAEDFLGEKHLGSPAFLTASGTQALEFATILLDLQPGDEVIVPAFTFTSAVTALVNFGIKPVFVDISLDDLNIDVSKVEEAVTPRTRAISVVNYGGNACDLEWLREFTSQRNLYLIEDNAHGLSGYLNGKPLGTFGDVSILSFHETKNYQCGEGGALIVNNPKLVARAHILKEKGTDRRNYLLGEVQKYEWVDKGGSFLLGEILSSYLFGQFDEYDSIHNTRLEISQYYENFFRNSISDRLALGRWHRDSSFHNYWILVPKESRPQIIEKMRNKGVQVNAHYQNLATSRASIDFGYQNLNTPNASLVADSLIRLPLYNEITEKQLRIICSNLLETFAQI